MNLSELISPPQSLGIQDDTFQNIGNYGDPSKNYGDNYGNFTYSPIQTWEMWLHKPEPVTITVPSTLTDLLTKLVNVLSDPGIGSKLSQILEGAK